MTLLDAFVNSLRDDLLITLSVGVGCVFVALCLEARSHFRLRVAVSFLLAFGWMVISNYYGSAANMNLGDLGLLRYSVFFLIFAFALNFWCRANFCQSVYAITVAYSIQNMCERLIEIPRGTLENFPILLDRACLALLMAVCLLVYYYILIGNARQRTMFDFSNLNSRVMLFLGVSVVAVSILLDLQIRKYTGTGNVGLANCHNLMSAVFSFLTVVVCMSHLRESDSERRVEISEHLLHSERQRYEQEKQVHDAINIKCHDIRHQIAALGEKGYREEIQRIGRLVDIYDTAPRTQNDALDVVLSNKMLACVNQGITLTCLADGRRLGFMESSDIFALFGNILDNAMEAAMAEEDPERRIISLTVGTTGDLLTIESQNFYVDEIHFQEGLPETNKADKDYHGFGMRSIRLLTEKYGGDLQISASDGIFTLSILLPVPV